tara:strand:+ start:245 stop:706 length:462 start_codon:yes stop_codon:yes gene_type:complete
MPRTTKTPSIHSPAREPDSKAFIKNLTGRPVEIDPVKEQDALFGEYQTILEQEKLLSDRKEEIRLDFKQRLLVLLEEVEKPSDCYIESSDEEMKFSIRQTKEYKYSVMTEGLREAHQRAAKDLKDLMNKEIRHEEATHLRTKTSVVFSGPKIK